VKFKTTLILLGVAVVLLVLVLFILPRRPADEALGPRGPFLTELQPVDIERIVLSGGAETIDLRRDDKGRWSLSAPLQAQADASEADRLAEELSRLRAERVADASPVDAASYGLPGREIRLWTKGQDDPVRIELGDENPVDHTLYARRHGEERVVLLPASFKTLLEKRPFDFRKKDIFSLDASAVRSIALRSRESSWRAVRRDEEWFLEEPVSGLAEKFRVDSLVNSLSGLRAVEFVSERKTDSDLKDFGLVKPDFEVMLSLPAAGQEVVFSLSRKADKAYAATSASNTIIAVEPYVLSDMERKPEELREKGVDVFNPWEAERLRVRAGSLEIALHKDEEGRWRFVSEKKEEADSSKVESFLRQIDGLQAVEFIDRPGPDAAYGLDEPRAEIVIGLKELGGKAREVTVRIGAEDGDKKQTVVKNPRLGYLLRVDSSFLADLPKTAAEWKKPEAAGDADEIES